MQPQENQNTFVQQPTQTTPSNATNLASSNQFQLWYVPQNSNGLAAKKGTAYVSPGLLVINDEASGAEVYRYQLTSDLKIKSLVGVVSILFLNGQSRRGAFQNQYRFFFYNPRFSLFIWAIIVSAGKARKFAESCRAAATASPSATST